jgi:catechol 2,3-dioxygenase-like lactoylglutathione lyase family enzyme
MKLEVVVVPVADVDRAKDFYTGPGPPELRLVPLVQRPGRQRLVHPGSHHAPAGPVTAADARVAASIPRPEDGQVQRRTML